MGKLAGYGLRKLAFAGEMGYMLGVCLKIFICKLFIVVTREFVAIREIFL